jgi:hypothetical protein
MIRTSTIVYIVVLLGLVGAYFYLRNRQQPAEIEVTVEPSVEISYLFSAEAGTPARIRVESKSGEIVELARDADNAWAVTQPIEAKADQGAAEAAASQITTMRILDTIPEIDPTIVGLATPEYVLTVEFTSDVEQSVEVGAVTPTESGYYVRGAAGEVMIVSSSAIDSLLGLLQNPPYLETPTPAFPATETQTPLPASQTPETDASAAGTATP